MYKIKEIYFTLQGEGHHTGRPALFCRFAGCNLWTGREEDRDKAICKFCDTDFWGTDGVHGGKYNSDELIRVLSSLWPKSDISPFIVCTGGEPGLQMDQQLIDLFHDHDFEIAIETNGTVTLPEGIDWVCVSPKADTEIITTKGHELKLVFPQSENRPEDYLHLDFQHFYLQPLDDENQASHIQACIEYCKAHPQWKLSLQTHKWLGID